MTVSTPQHIKNQATPRLLLQSPYNSLARAEEEREISLYAAIPFKEAFAKLQATYGFYLFTDELLWQMKQTRWFKSLNNPFRIARYMSVSRVGALMDHRWRHATCTFDEWVEHYTAEMVSLPSLFRLADLVCREQRHLLDDDFAQKVASTYGEGSLWLSVLWIRLFLETEMGFRPEFVGCQMLAARFNSARRATAAEDYTHHLDAVVEVPLCGYQIKHALFLSKTRNAGFRADQENNFYSQLNWEEQTGGAVYYLLAEDLLADRFNPIPLRAAMNRAGI